MSDSPALRREFVGIMFGLAVAEVGLQTAAVVQAGNLVRHLPALSHLLLALIVIAASWVGWSRTQAQTDVKALFEWAFLVLLLDTAMVVTYFILVRTVDFSETTCRIDSASTVAQWHVVIFVLYLLWDGVTKVAMYPKPVDAGWFDGWKKLEPGVLKAQKRTMKRAWPTFVCLLLSIVLWWVFTVFDPKHEHLIAADFALLSVVLLFRALKGVVKGPDQTPENIAWNGLCARWLGAMFVVATSLTIYSIPLPLWQSLQEIRTPITCNAAPAVQ